MPAIFTVMVSLPGSNFEMMPRKTGASALIAHSDSSLRSARRSYFSSPRGQPCLCCWLVSPPIGERPPSLLRSLFSVPLWVVSALALGTSCPSVTSSLPDATRYAASRHTTTNYQLAPPVSVPTPKPTNTAGRVTARLLKALGAPTASPIKKKKAFSTIKVRRW